MLISTISRKKLSILLLFLTICMVSRAQVEKPERIAGKYTGKEKRGLAHGKGKAVGTDTYEGEFKRGYPHGEGVYIFGEAVVNGDTLYEKGDKYIGEFRKGLFDGKGKLVYNNKNKETKEGYWKDGNYIGLTKDGYAILVKQNVQRVECRYDGSARNDIYIEGLVDIVEVGNTNLSFNGINSYTNIPIIQFPFTLHIKGTIRSTGAKVELKILFERPGIWTVIVTGYDIL